MGSVERVRFDQNGITFTERARNTKIFAKKEFPERPNVGDARPAVSDARGRPDSIVE